MGLVEKITEWLLEKEEELARECAVPKEEIEYQIAKVEQEKEKLKKECDEKMKTLDEILTRLKKIENIEALKCATKESNEGV